jgi:hypothetical protein
MKRLWSLALVACCSLLLNACFEPEEDYSGDNNGANNGGENNGGNNGGENNGANNGNNGNNGGNNGEGQICGTRGAAPCAEGEFCSWSEAAMCGASDLPGTCQPIPEACDQVYEPVCGCDGQTYGNACEANAAGVSFASKGECDVIEPPDGVRCGARAGDTCGPDEFCDYQEGEYCGAADAEATCQPRPEACPQVYAPVCGCDGQTYGNDCEANGNGVGVLHSGECGDQPPEEIFCGGFGAVECPEGQFCFYDADAICGADDGGGVCRPTPEVCPDIYAPVCGCDGQVYGNECEANGAGTSAAPSDWCDMPPVGVSCGARAGRHLRAR